MKKILIAIFLGVFACSLLPQEHEKESQVFDEPLLITSAGQSADVQLASVLAKRAGLEATLSKLATAEQLEGVKTVALVIGASLKGLGAAGLDVSEEKRRVQELLEEAQKKQIPVLCLHLGGEARRGQLSDEFITTFLPCARVAVVVKSGNKDGLFTRICQKNRITLVEVEKTIDALQPLKKLFGHKMP
ncbi:MAG: DUF6305 family protein [Candidatus Aminicenantales bacterium]